MLDLIRHQLAASIAHLPLLVTLVRSRTPRSSTFNESSTPPSSWFAVGCTTTFLALVLWIIGQWVAGKVVGGGGAAGEEDLPDIQVEWPEAILDNSWASSSQRRILLNPSITSHLDDSSLLPSPSSAPPPSTPEAADDQKDVEGQSRKEKEKRKYVTCYDPATCIHLGTIPLPTHSELTDRITLLDGIFPAHRRTSFHERRRLLRTIRRFLLDPSNSRRALAIACRDTGKTEVDAAFGELLTILAKIDWLIAYGEKALANEERPAGNLMLAHKRSWVQYEPLGVVCAIVSWNYPLHNALSPILAALFSGNTILLKPSEQVLWSSTWAVDLVQAALEACGMERDAVQLGCAMPEDAGVIIKDERIRHITFIGSEPVGKIIATTAAQNLTPLCIELGGKDAAILLPSTDIDTFASTFLRAAFQASGQNCIGIERFIVHESLVDRLVTLLKPRIEALRQGKDYGAMISTARFDELESIIGEAEKDGAKVLLGGKRGTGHYFQPTLVVGVKKDMRLAREEVFAPIMTILPFKSINEAISISNSTRYGLGAAVFGEDARECQIVADKLEVGMVAVNDFGIFYLNQNLPFGGTKSSGYNRFGGPEGLRGLCNVKAVVVDRFGWLGVKTKIPRLVDYPLPYNSDLSWSFLVNLIRFSYAPGWLDKVRGVVGLIKATMIGRGGTNDSG